MAKEIKIPKRVAGVKIPKSIRKGPISEFLNSSGGQVLLAEAILALGALYATRRFDAGTPTGEFIRHPIESARASLAGRHSSDRLSAGPDRLRRAISAGVQAFRAALYERDAGRDVSLETDVAAAAAGVDAESPRQRASSTRSESPEGKSASGPH